MIGYDKMLKEPKYLPKGPAIIYGLKVELAFSLYFTNTIKSKIPSAYTALIDDDVMRAFHRHFYHN